MAFLDLDEVKQHLGKDLGGAVDDDELLGMMAAAEAAIVKAIGSVTSGPRDEWHDGGSTLVALLSAPVLAVTLVAESVGTWFRELTEQPLDGASFDAYGYTVDLSAGVINRRVSGSSARFAPGSRNIHVVYTAGWATPPADIVLAGKELTRHLWRTQRGSGNTKPGSSTNAEVANTLANAASAFPIRVEQLIHPYRSPGIA